MNQLQLFQPKQFPQELFGNEYITLDPYHVLSEKSTGPIEFVLKENKDYIDLQETVLRIKCKIVNADYTAIPVPAKAGDDHVSFVNNAMHSLFSDVILLINDKRVEGGDKMYPYKAYMNTVFRYSKETQEGQLFSVGFIRDDATKMEDVSNAAFLKRKTWTDLGATKEFIGKLHLGMFNQERLLVPGADLHLKLERAKDTFSIFNANPTLRPRVIIESAVLELMTVKVNPQLMNYHAQMLAKGIPAEYPYHRVEMDVMTIRENTLGDKQDFLFSGQVPKYVIMVMVANSAMNGEYRRNPYNFKFFNATYIDLTKDRHAVPFPPFEPDFANNNYLQEYMSVFQSNGLLGKNCILPINYDEYKSGYTNLQWNLSDNRKGANSNPDPRGNLKIEVKFTTKTTEAINVVLYGIFDGSVMIFGDDTTVTNYN